MGVERTGTHSASAAVRLYVLRLLSHMAKSREAAIQRIIRILALARDRAGTPEGDTAQARARAMMTEYEITDADVAEAEAEVALAAAPAHPILWRAVKLYPGRDGKPAAWQLAAAQWAAARHGGGAGYAGGVASILAEDAQTLDVIQTVIRIVSEFGAALASRIWNMPRPTHVLFTGWHESRTALSASRAHDVIGSTSGLTLDVIGWILVCVLADTDAPAAPAAPATPSGSPGAPSSSSSDSEGDSSAASASARGSRAPAIGTAARPTNALAVRAPWAPGQTPQECGDISGPVFPEALDRDVINEIVIAARECQACLPPRTADG